MKVFTCKACNQEDHKLKKVPRVNLVVMKLVRMKSSRCVLILIYLINYIVSISTTNKF